MSDDLQKPDDTFLSIHIRRRPWYGWLTWLAWLIVLGIFLDFAINSAKELESQASALSWIVFFLLLGGGILLNTLQRIDAEEEGQQRW